MGFKWCNNVRMVFFCIFYCCFLIRRTTNLAVEPVFCLSNMHQRIIWLNWTERKKSVLMWRENYRIWFTIQRHRREVKKLDPNTWFAENNYGPFGFANSIEFHSQFHLLNSISRYLKWKKNKILIRNNENRSLIWMIIKMKHCKNPFYFNWFPSYSRCSNGPFDAGSIKPIRLTLYTVCIA